MARNKTQKEMQSYPDGQDVLTANMTMSGQWSAIMVFEAAFANNATDFIVGGAGVNYSALNTKIQNGTMLPGSYTKISVPAAATNMVVIGFRG